MDAIEYVTFGVIIGTLAAAGTFIWIFSSYSFTNPPIYSFWYDGEEHFCMNPTSHGCGYTFKDCDGRTFSCVTNIKETKLNITQCLEKVK